MHEWFNVLNAFCFRFNSIWLLYLDLTVKTINEAKKQCTTEEIMRNYFVQYDFLYFTPSADEKETQTLWVFKNVLCLPKHWWSPSLNGLMNAMKNKMIKT